MELFSVWFLGFVCSYLKVKVGGDTRYRKIGTWVEFLIYVVG